MRIRTLEIQGFKSFPDRTRFEFGDGLSGVVGPNGCGKSNVVDAVKWCLGEQSIKRLRGQNMEDVIFNGSVARNPTGLAEVTLTFDAGDEPFPGEFARCSQVQVTRRLFRDGHAEYMLNQKKVRLRDVHDLLMDTGAGNRLYSFIEQGRIGEIVDARPEQRRTLIEEAAGISRYKARRDEAEKKLSDTLRNLERVADIVDELGGRMRALERQVRKVIRYRRQRAVVRQGEIFLAMARYTALAGDRRALRDQLREAENEERLLRRQVEQREKELERRREEVEALDAVVGRLRDELSELEASRREKESARLYQGREVQTLRQRIEELAQQVQQATAEAERATMRLAEARAERTRVEGEIEAATKARSQAEDEAHVAEAELGTARKEANLLESAVVADMTRLSRKRAEGSASEQRLAELDERLASALEQRGPATVTELHAAEHKAEEARTRAQAVLAASHLQLSDAQDRVQASRVAVADRKKASDTADRANRDAMAAVIAVRARLESLQALLDQHEGVGDGVKAALRAEGALGTLAELLDVPQELEGPLSIALGELLMCVVVRDEAAASRAAQLADGRVNIAVAASTGALTGPWAAIGGSPRGVATLSRLLGPCREAPDLASALKDHAEHGKSVLFEGGYVDRRGVVSQGQPQGAGAGVLGRRRQLAQLGVQAETLNEAADAAHAAAEAARTEWMVAQAAVEAAAAAVEARRVARSEAELALRDAEHEHATASRARAVEEARVARVAQEEVKLREAREKAVQARDDAGVEIRQLEAGLSDRRSALGAAQAALAEREQALTALRERRVHERARVTGLQQRVGLLRQNEIGADEAASAARRQVEAGTGQDALARTRIEELLADDARLAEELQALGEHQAAVRTRLDEEKEGVKAHRDALEKADKAIRQHRERREEATGRRADLERRVEELKVQIRQIRERLEERYQLSVAGMIDRMARTGHLMVEAGEILPGDLPGAEQWESELREPIEALRVTTGLLGDEGEIAAWMDRLKEAHDKLERLGDVNLGAMEEYRDVATRHDHLDEQRADLEASVQSIRQTIAKLNRTCRERFRDAFDRVDAYFREIYPRMVGGGQAHLVLTDENDLLETGVDIYVQPPGKKLQHLSLLSGGETAMCAIALIFALFTVKPSPFCLLDEVDAPLDEGNGARFNNMLKEMSRLSQFIVVTHNKKTMECMDTLYGVTMPRPGCSTLVSVQLD